MEIDRKDRKESKKAKITEPKPQKETAAKTNKEDVAKSNKKDVAKSNKEDVAVSSNDISKDVSGKEAVSTVEGGEEKSKTDLKRERRALQEAQRATKEKAAKEKTAAKEAAAAAKDVQKTTKRTVKITEYSRVRPLVKGGSTVPFCGHLRDPYYKLKEPSFYLRVHDEFEKVTQELYVSTLYI